MLDPEIRCWWGGNSIIRKGTHAQRIVQLMAKGATQEEIMQVLGISKATFWRRIKALGGIKAAKRRAENVNLTVPSHCDCEPQLYSLA